MHLTLTTLCEYQKTGLDWKIGSPQKYEEWFERTLREQYPDEAPPADARKQIDEALENSWFPRVEITPELQKQLKIRLSPFFFEDNVIEHSFQARSQPGYPFTALSVIIKQCRHSDRLVTANSDVDGIPPLWVESIIGAIYPEQLTRLEACGVHVERVTLELADVFTLMTSQVDRDRRAPPDYVAYGPFEFSMAALSEYRSLQERTWDLPAVVVAGSRVQDFALYFGLSRMRPRVSWLWPAWLNTLRTAALRAESGGDPVRKSERHASDLADALNNALLSRTIKNIDFVSASLGGGELATLIADFGATSPRAENAIKTQGRVCGTVRDLLAHARVTFNTDNIAVPTTQQVLEGKAVGFFPTPKPKGFATVVPYEHRWITELRIEGLGYPRHPALGQWLVSHHLLSTKEARTGKQGLCYFCPNVAYFGGDVDTILVRPEIRVPPAEAIFQKLAESVGLSCKVSDKGFFQRDLVEKMSGLEYAAALVRAPRHFAVLTAYLPGVKKPPAVGLDLASDKRRYLSLKDVTSTLGTPAEAVELIDLLVGRSIMHRGTVLKCQYCRTADWFSMKDLDHEFSCKRCARKQAIQSRHTLGQNEPVWYYKLDEIIYQGICNDMHVPLLALDYLRRTHTSFSYADELELWRPNQPRPFIEIDLCCICDGSLTIGEAKKTGRIEGGGKRERRSLAKYRDAADLLGARRIVLATSVTWSAETRANAAVAFANTGIEVVHLEEGQILSVTDR